MAKVTFDGEALLIITELGVTEVDIEDDVYSEWKRWQLIDDNQKYFPLFRTVGGDPLTPGISAGAYFFIQNQDGWRWKPAEEDATVLITGNLAPEDSSLPILTPTLGPYTVLYQGLQPITQSVEDIFVQQQDSAYNGIVAYNSINGTAGSKYPIGLKSNPVNNVVDAFKIAANLKLKEFLIMEGLFDLDRDAISYIFSGAGGASFLKPNSYNISFSSINDLVVVGTPDMLASSNIRISRSLIDEGILNFNGNMERVGISGEVSLKGEDNIFSFCYNIHGTVTHGPCTINFNALPTEAILRNWAGELALTNMIDSDSIADIDVVSGKILLDSSNSAGNVSIRGIGDISDNSLGVTINRDGFIEGTDIIQLREYIYIDTVHGVTGTTENVGISTNPVNNMGDAYILAIRRGARKFSVDGNVALDQDYEGWGFVGTVSNTTAIIDFGGYSVDNSEFIGVSIDGTGVGAIIANTCKLLDIRGVSGEFTMCGINQAILPGNNTRTSFVNCFSEVPGSGTPIIDLGAVIDSDLQLRAYSGGVTIKNCDVSTQSVSIDLVAGHVILDPTCTAGDIVIRGAGWLSDNSAGSTVNTRGLLGEMEIAIERILGLSQHNYRITDQVYDDKLMLSSTIRLYATKADADADINHTFEYVMDAAYDGVGRLTDYKMTTAT